MSSMLIGCIAPGIHRREPTDVALSLKRNIHEHNERPYHYSMTKTRFAFDVGFSKPKLGCLQAVPQRPDVSSICSSSSDVSPGLGFYPRIL